MRSMLTATLILVATAASAQAQMTAPAAVTGVKPKTVDDRSDPPRACRPRPIPPMRWRRPSVWRIQSDLAWVGTYNGAITGEVSERMVAAIKEFQKDRGGKQTGVLNPQERGVLAETARRRQDDVGWKIVTDAGTGARLGIPTKLVPQQSSDANGAKWSSSTGTIQIVLARRKEAAPTTAKLAEQEKKEPGPQGRLHRGQAGFLRAVGSAGPEEILCARHVQGRRGPHPHHPLRPGHRKHRRAGGDRDVERVQSVSIGAQVAGPPPRKTVEYGTGVVVSEDGAIVTDRRDHRCLPDDHDRRPRPCRPRRRGQGSRSRAAANLRRARVEAACARRRSSKIQRSN